VIRAGLLIVDIRNYRMFNSEFSVQLHKQKKGSANRQHLDLRILNRRGDSVWSWAIPKSEFPDGSKKVLAIRTPNHKPSYMYFEGKLKSGDEVFLMDRGTCKILVEKHNLIVIYFQGTKIRGAYNFIRMQNSKNKNSWLVMKSKKR
jgi:hypothetical protein